MPKRVWMEHQIIVACDVAAEANDKQQAVPMALLTAANLEQAGIKRLN